MVFSSMIFLWIFLPVVFVAHRLCGKKIPVQNVLLLIASLIFYAWGEPFYIILLLLSIAINYAFGLAMDKAEKNRTAMKVVLGAGIIVNLGILGYYKYFNFSLRILNRLFGLDFAMRDIALPIGISFFTFQAISYLFDIYKEKAQPQKNLLKLALYLSFFPRLISGPIAQYHTCVEELSNRTTNWEKTAQGIRLFCYGLGKKVILANTLGACVDQIFALDINNTTSGMIWVAAIFYTLQIYYDFSGYSDMAIGLGKMFGFTIPKNFDYPYLSGSISEFWRRWHITLGAWFREYLYIPLGGNRKGKVRRIVNLGIVFLATGLWHGATTAFVFWGLWHGFFNIIERFRFGKWMEKTKVLKYVYANLVVMLGWVIFRVADLRPALSYIKRMFMPWVYNTSTYSILELVSHRAVFFAVLGVLGAGIIQTIVKKVWPGVEKLKYGVLEMVFCMLILAYSTMLLVGNTYNAFIYFGF